jgi:ferrous iron transport protein A
MTESDNQTQKALMALAQVPLGTRVRIVEVRGGRQLTRRLLSLGLRIGSEVELLHHRGRGVVVASAGNRIAIGGGIAEKLMAEQIAPA